MSRRVVLALPDELHVDVSLPSRPQVTVSASSGLPGPRGPEGPQGPPGDPGADGAPGTPGADGADGAPGADGADGAPGLPGADGTDGVDGAKGDKGDKGDPGTPGTNGTQGIQGIPGIQGIQGVKGDKGDPGTPGTNGATGATGPQGPMWVDPDALAVGVSTFSRRTPQQTSSGATGRLELAYFTSVRTFTATRLGAVVGSSVNAAGATMNKLGLYLVDPNTDDLTLIGSTPNDSAMWTVASTYFYRTMSASASVVAGTRYAFCRLIVSAGAISNFYASSSLISTVANQLVTRPRINGQLNSQTDLPPTILASGVVGMQNTIYGEVVP